MFGSEILEVAIGLIFVFLISRADSDQSGS